MKPNSPEYVKLSSDDQSRLGAILRTACKEKNISSPFAANKAQKIRDFINILEKNCYSLASVQDILDIAEVLGVESAVKTILQNCDPLTGSQLEVVLQLRSKASMQSGTTDPTIL